MKLDLSKLPVGEAVIGFMLIATIVTFILAFTYVDTLAPDTGGEPSPTASGGASETPPSGGLEVVMTDNKFDPDSLTVVSGEETTISLTNEGAAIHNLRIAGADGDYDTSDDVVSDPDTIRGGQSGTIVWTPEAPGDVDFRCDFHPTEMKGTITVQ